MIYNFLFAAPTIFIDINEGWKLETKPNSFGGEHVNIIIEDIFVGKKEAGAAEMEINQVALLTEYFLKNNLHKSDLEIYAKYRIFFLKTKKSYLGP